MSASPVLSPARLQAIAQEFLSFTVADTASVTIHHVAIGMARVTLGRVRMQDNGDQLELSLMTQFGRRARVWLEMSQMDTNSLRKAAAYLDRTARALPGDPTRAGMPVPPRTYLPNSTWRDNTATAFAEARHAAVPALMEPILDAGMTASAFVGVYAHSTAFANKEGILAVGQETDAELVVTGWTPDGKGAGWAGQAAREWRELDPAAIASRAIELTRRSANAVAFEPGRHTAILDRPAVAQIVHGMGWAFDAQRTLAGSTPLYNPHTQRPRLGERIMDPRILLRSDPSDREGGTLPFNGEGYPILPMTWVDHGVHTNLGFRHDFAASVGYAPANDPPSALRLERTRGGGPETVDEMIAACADGIYVNRFSYVGGVGGDSTLAMMSGATSGGCFLVRNGKIDKPIKNLRFLESPWLFLNRLEAIGTSARAAFGYAPWAGRWPIAPTIVPPLMIRDFNFNALADSV